MATMLVAGALALGTGVVSATAAGVRVRLALVTPRPYAKLLIDRPTLIVRLRVSGPGFQAVLSGRNVTRRFGPPVRGVRTARLVRGRDFKLGRNSFLVQVGGRDSDSRRATGFTFTAWRRVDRMISLQRVGARGRLIGRAPAYLRLRSPRVPSALTVTVNGRRADGDLIPRGARLADAALGASSGLRYGTNRIVATMSGPGWTRAVKAVNVFVPRTAPIAGAGPNRFAGAGDPILLDGSRSSAPRRGVRLVYRWRIASGPRGAQARLIGARSKRARLVARTPGRYRLRLTVTALRRGARASAAAAGPVTEDETVAAVSPTSLPMGDPIETIARVPLGGGAYSNHVSLGGQPIPNPGGNWAQMVVLDQSTLQVVSNQGFSASNPGALPTAVKNTTNQQIVILSGEGIPQVGNTGPLTTALGQAVGMLGGTLPSSGSGATPAIASGNWSIIGTNGMAGRMAESFDQVTEAPVPGSPAQTGPGSLNGYMQNVRDLGVFYYVSPEFVPIDTRASGSSATQNVIRIGSSTYASQPIPGNSLAMHVVAVSDDGSLAPVLNDTFVIDTGNDTNQGSWDPSSNTGTGVEGLAFTLQMLTHSSPHNVLIVMNTMGTSTVFPWTAPGGSPYWVNDSLLHPTKFGMWDWYYQPYATGSLDSFWNPNYPTVAGQVGLLTGFAGHDLIANLGGSNLNGPGPNGKTAFDLTQLQMVANSHPYDTSMNHIYGDAPGATSVPGHPAPDRLVGTLTRTPESQWRVNGNGATPAFDASQLWELAFQGQSQPWPCSAENPQCPNLAPQPNASAQMAAADQYIASRLWPGLSITDVRPQYYLRDSFGYWSNIANGTGGNDLPAVRYESGQGFSHATFSALKAQLGTEMSDVAQVQTAVHDWKRILDTGKLNAFANIQTAAGKLIGQALTNWNQYTEPTSVDPLAIASNALWIGGSLIGFPEVGSAFELAEQFSNVAGVLDFANASLNMADGLLPVAGSPAPQGPNTQLITDRADMIGQDLFDKMQTVSGTLSHLGDIYVSDWGKLQAASIAANNVWINGSQAKQQILQSFDVMYKQQFYEAMLPLGYTQWIVAPWDTISNGSGPNRPGTDYQCIRYRAAYQSNQIRRPFSGEPMPGAMSWSNYRPWASPGDTTPPAVPFNVNYIVRALKSSNNPLTLQVVDQLHDQAGITIDDSGTNPPAKMINRLFETVNPADNPADMHALGMSKTAFYGSYGGGPGNWRRMICAQGGR